MREPHNMMPPKPRPRPETQSQKFMRYFNLFMTLVYPAVGLYILLSSSERMPLDKQTKVILGIILILYGIFRFFRTYQQHFRKQDPDRFE